MDTIKNFFKNNSVTLLLLSALIVVSFFAVHFYRKSQQPAQLAHDKKILQNPAATVIDTFIDVNGESHAEIKADDNVVQQSSLKDTSIKRDSLIKKIDQDLNLADASHLLEVTQENIRLRAAVLKLRNDSANLALLAYNDKWLSFKYDPRDSTVLDFKYDARLSQVKFGKRHLFSNTPVIDFYGDDPRITFGGFNHFSVAVPQPLFGLSADAKAAYILKTGQVVPSVGLNLRVNNFYLEGRNYWSPAGNSFRQLVALGYRQNIF